MKQDDAAHVRIEQLRKNTPSADELPKAAGGIRNTPEVYSALQPGSKQRPDSPDFRQPRPGTKLAPAIVHGETLLDVAKAFANMTSENLR